jgi:glycosyltransferase involved in cell wall biosynthesis
VTSAAFHVDQLFYRVPGGIGTYIRELVPAMRRVDPGLEITLFHARFDRTQPEAWMKAFPEVEISQGIRSLYPSWAVLGRPSLPAAVGTCDVVHAPSPAPVPPAGRGQRLVVTVHDLAFRIYPEMFPPAWRNLFRLGLRRAARRADAILVPSRNTGSDLMRLAGVHPSRIRVVPLAASLPRTASDPEEVLGRLRVRKPYLLFVGTLEPRKNLIRLVRAYRRAARSAALPHTLVLAGPLGWGVQRLHRELAVPAPGQIVLTGRIAPEDLDGLYRGADAFVYPSVYEGFGLPVLEAFSRGVPTIVSRASSLPEVAGDAAIAVEPRSVTDLAEAVVRVLTDDREAKRLAEAALKRAEDFSWERTARETLDVYERVLRYTPRHRQKEERGGR